MTETEELRECSQCKRMKPTSEFGNCRLGKNGSMWECRDCHNARYDDYYRQHANEILEQKREWFANLTEAEREILRERNRRYYLRRKLRLRLG